MVALHLPWQVQQPRAVELGAAGAAPGAGIQGRGAIQGQIAADGHAQLARLVGVKRGEQQARRRGGQARAQLHQFRIAQVAVRGGQVHHLDFAALAQPFLLEGGADAALRGRTGRQDQRAGARLFAGGPGGDLARFRLDRQAHHQQLGRQARLAAVVRVVQGDRWFTYQVAVRHGRHGRARQRTHDDVLFLLCLRKLVQHVAAAVARVDHRHFEAAAVALVCGHEAGAQQFGGRTQGRRAQRQQQADVVNLAVGRRRRRGGRHVEWRAGRRLGGDGCQWRAVAVVRGNIGHGHGKRHRFGRGRLGRHGRRQRRRWRQRPCVRFNRRAQLPGRVARRAASAQHAGRGTNKQ